MTPQEIPVSLKEPVVSVSSPTRDSCAIQKKTFLQELKPWSSRHPDTSYLRLIIRPWPLLAYPAVLYSFLTFSATIGWSICFFDTQASIFQSPPYNMTPGVNSLVYISAMIGISLGTYVGGAFTDSLAERSARKKNGFFEPETRLIAMIIPFFVIPVGLLM
jgi:hypothetical protein